MRKLIDFMAVTGFLVSGTIVAVGVGVALNKDQITENIKTQMVQQIQEAVTGIIGSPGGIVDSAIPDSALDSALPVPTLPF